MLDNNFFNDFNGDFYRYTTSTGEIGYIRNIKDIPGLINLCKENNLSLFTSLVDLANVYHSSTIVLTDGKKITGGAVSIENDVMSLRVILELKNNIISAYLESSVYSGKKYLDITDIEDCQLVIDSVLNLAKVFA